MNLEHVNELFFEILINGDRPAARNLVENQLKAGLTPETLINEVFWPTYETIDRLHRADQLTALAHHLATRLLRVLVDQNSSRLSFSKPMGKTIFAACGPSEADEMGAQMAVDLLEVQGYSVSFAGGGIAADEILAQVNERKPDILLLFASAPGDLPGIRAMVDQLKEIGACPNLQIAVGGGVFNRAEGLAEEIGADLWANSPQEIAERLVEEPARRADSAQRTVGKNRRVKKAA